MRFDPAKFEMELARRGLDGNRLAALSGLDKSVVSDARRGRTIRPQTMRKIAAAIYGRPVVEGAELLG